MPNLRLATRTGEWAKVIELELSETEETLIYNLIYAFLAMRGLEYDNITIDCNVIDGLIEQGRPLQLQDNQDDVETVAIH